MFESSWIRPHVEGHFLFGLYNSKHKILWICLIIFLYFSISLTIYAPIPFNKYTLLEYTFNLRHIVVILVTLYFAFFADLTQSGIFWISTKITLSIGAFIFFIIGIIDFFRENNEWSILILMAILWMPSIELHKRFFAYQKILSVFRLFSTAIIFVLMRWGVLGT